MILDDIRKLAANILAYDCTASPAPWRWADWRQMFGRKENLDQMYYLESGHPAGDTMTPIIRRREDESKSVMHLEDDIENEVDKALIPLYRNKAPILADFAMAVLDALDEESCCTDEDCCETDCITVRHIRQGIARRLEKP